MLDNPKTRVEPLTAATLKELKPGELIRHVDEGKALQVIDNAAGRVTAARLTSVTNPIEWVRVHLPADMRPPVRPRVEVEGLRLGLFDGRSSSLSGSQLLMTIPGPESGVLSGDVAFGKFVATIHEDTESFGEWTPVARFLALAPQLLHEAEKLLIDGGSDEGLRNVVAMIHGTAKRAG